MELVEFMEKRLKGKKLEKVYTESETTGDLIKLRLDFEDDLSLCIEGEWDKSLTVSLQKRVVTFDTILK